MINSNKNNRGQILVLVALSLVVLLGFAALAIDIGYFYHTKNQLQGAADAAALAGAAKLNIYSTLTSTTPRTEALKYANLNSASGSPVQLDPNDITLGSWVSNTFNPAGTPVNAVRVTARKTNKDPAGFPRFFGKIFDTTNQNLGTEAIAYKPARSSSFFYFCVDVCTSCTTAMCSITPARVLETKTSVPYINQFAWTSLQNPVTSAKDVSTYICLNAPFEDSCNIPIYSTNGGPTSVLMDLESAMYNPNYETDMKDIDINTGKISGWWVIVPVISPCPPGKQPAAQIVYSYANVHIKAICASSKGNGSYGCKGNYDAANMGPTNVCKDPKDPKGKANYPDSIIIDQLQCRQCGTTDIWPGLKSILAK